MRALIVGATGATGQVLPPLLAHSPNIGRIDSFGRRVPAFTHEKLHNHIVDFSRVSSWSGKVWDDTVFACLGTTLKDAGGKEAQWQIDYEANLAFTAAARHNGARTLALVSAAGVGARSRFFYPRMKGRLEEAVAALNYPRLMIFRPPLLIRPSG